MTRGAFAALAALAFAVGCDSAPDLGAPSRVDIISRAENQYQTRDMVIRAYVTYAAGKEAEVTGARCTLSSGLVRARSLVTPGVAKVPTYLQGARFANRGKPPALTGTCSVNGRSTPVRSEATSAVRNTSVQSTSQSGTTTSTRLTSRRLPTLPWYYPGTRVVFGAAK